MADRPRAHLGATARLDPLRAGKTASESEICSSTRRTFLNQNLIQHYFEPAKAMSLTAMAK
jgi:hypothetical protein